jgi:hypothetical protein
MMSIKDTIAAIRRGERPDYEELLVAAKALARLATADKHSLDDFYRITTGEFKWNARGLLDWCHRRREELIGESTRYV